MNSLLINVELKNNTSFSYTIQHINVLHCILDFVEKNCCVTNIDILQHRIYPTIKIIYSKFDKWQF